ncbi:MAG: hypothetical protein NZ993_01210 [Bacteroidetes bacterium]|nr:hypothetical protein [Bacteroidota bacterium]
MRSGPEGVGRPTFHRGERRARLWLRVAHLVAVFLQVPFRRAVMLSGQLAEGVADSGADPD